MLLRTPDSLLREALCPALATERLVLRKPTLGDTAAITHLVNDWRVAENLRRVPHPYAETDAEDFIAHVETGRDLIFLVTLANDPIGMIGLDLAHPERPELGYWFGVDHWGQGFATEAVRAVIDLAFEDLDVSHLYSAARVTNPASRHVLEKCGFQWTGVELHRFLALGSSTPVDCFCLDRRVWSSLKTWANAARG